MDAKLLELLACPRCRGALRQEGARLRCGCGGNFAATGGVPRLADGAGGRDPKIAAELEAQVHAHALYVDRQSVVNHWEERVLPRLCDWLADEAGPVLDLGCGVGHFGRVWAAAGRRTPMYGMDLVVELLGDVTAGYDGLFEGDVHRLPVRDGAFGAVVVANALHHMADPVAALREVRRALRPGGVVLGYDPRELAPLELIKKVVRRKNDAFGEHHRAFRIDEYRQLFGDAGLRVDRFAAVDAVGPLVATGLDLLRAGRFGVAAPAARMLAAVDGAIERADATRRLGLMLMARARRD